MTTQKPTNADEPDVKPFAREGGKLGAIRRKANKGARFAEMFRNLAILDAKGNRAGRIIYGDRNAVMQLSVTGGEQNPGSSAARMFLITAVNGDSLTCVEWDGATQGSEVEVAKPIHQRTSNTTETVDGTDLTYTYSDSNNRLTSDGTNSQYEVCYPRYVANDATYSVIWAVLSDNGTGVADVDWIEITTRVWLRKYTQRS